MKKQEHLAIHLIDPDPDQPRKHFDEAELLALGQNLLKHGQQVPVIIFAAGERFVLVDGERRWRAAALVGIATLSAIVLPSRPTASEVHVLRMSIDVHKLAHSAVERSDLLIRIQSETDWSVSEIAEHLGMKQPVCSKLLAFQKLGPEVRELLHRGDIDIEKAFSLTQEPDPVRQLALAKQSRTLTREQLRQKLKTPGTSEAKLASARLNMPGGIKIDVRGKALTLPCVIEVLTETVRILKKGLSAGWDLSTQCRVLRDQAKELPKSALKKHLKGA